MSELGRQLWIEPIEAFVRNYGHKKPRWAIVCTYEFDIQRLEHDLLPVLTRRGRGFRVAVLVDRGILEGNLRDVPALQCNLHGIRVSGGGVFHPKLVFLRAGPQVRVCFGSANLTDGGLGGNLELWTHTEDAEIVAGVGHFLESLGRSKVVFLDAAAKRNIRRALSGLKTRPSSVVWTSLEESFSRRLGRYKQNWSKVTFLSPLYAKPQGLRGASAVFKGAIRELFTDGRVSIAGLTAHQYQPPSPADNATGGDDEAWPGTLHAKAYLLHGHERTSMWIGSANFTQQALTKGVSNGGNVELLIEARLPEDEIRAFDRELRKLFPGKNADADPPERRQSHPCVLAATVLSGELSNNRGGWRLTVQTVPRVRSVKLEYKDRQSKLHRWTMQIRNCRGMLEGAKVDAAFKEIDRDAPSILILRQLIHGKKLPIVINVPQVPAEDAGSTTQAALDALIDELRGHLPRPRLPPDRPSEDDIRANPSSDQEGEDEFAKDVEKRLDEVKHQGELDQLAVKAALLRRVIVRASDPGDYRGEMLRHSFETIKAAYPRHLIDPLKRFWFGGVGTGKG